MLKQDLLISEPKAVTASAAAPGIKTVLVHIFDAGTASQRIEAALAIARAHSAHVTCLQVTPAEAYVAFDGFGGLFVMNEVMKAIDEQTEQLRKQVEEKLAGEDVSWDYIASNGSMVPEIARHGALADLIVTGREPASLTFGVSSTSFLGDLLQVARTPLFISGSTAPDPAAPAIVGWNGSFEAANAARASIGLLRRAPSVRVLSVTSEPEEEGTMPGTQLLEYLSRHGVHAELVVETSRQATDDDFVAASLIGHARSTGGYVVMGAYSRSRLKESLFGGVTRTMLRDCDIPLVVTG